MPLSNQISREPRAFSAVLQSFHKQRDERCSANDVLEILRDSAEVFRSVGGKCQLRRHQDRAECGSTHDGFHL